MVLYDPKCECMANVSIMLSDPNVNVVRGYGSDGEEAQGAEREVYEEDGGGRWGRHRPTVLQGPRWIHDRDLQLWESEAGASTVDWQNQITLW